MWTRLAKQAGVTEAEIAEAILVSRPMKSATVNDTAADAFAWLEENRKVRDRRPAQAKSK